MPADDADVPIQTRCPSCTAAIPSAAAWCSLCHADLRPRSVPQRAAPSVLPDPSYAAAESADRRPRTPPVTTVIDEPAPTGRHSRDHASEPARPAPGHGRHAAGRGRSVTPSAAPRDARPDLPVLSPATLAERTEAEIVADQMISRLAVEETRTAVLDPDDLPGGKWGLIVGGALAVLVVLLVLSVLITAVTNR